MTPPTTDVVYRRSREISFQDFGGEGLLVVPRRALQVVLNSTSLRLLQLVDGKRSTADLAAAFAAEYDAPSPEVLAADIAEALAELEELGAVERLTNN